MVRKRRRRRRLKLRFDEMYMWVFLGVIVFCIAIVTYPTAMGLDAQVGLTLTNLLAPLLLTCIAVYMLAQTHRVGKFGGMIFLGVAVAVFIGGANTESLLTTELLNGLTLIQLQTWIVAISTIFGAIAFSFHR